MKVAYTVAAPEARADRVLAWRGPLEESIPSLARMGYDGVELMVRDPEAIDGDAVESLAERHGLSIPVIGTGPIALERGITLSSADETGRREAIEAGLAALRLCRQLGAVLNIGQFRGRCDPGEVETTVSRFADSLRRLLSAAEPLNVRVALEVQNRFQSDFFRTADETLEFVEALDSSQVGLLLDTFHMNIEESSFDGPLRRASARLFHVHFSENHRGAPGTGLIPFDFVARVLNDIGYTGWISVEIAQQPSPEEAASAAIKGLSNVVTVEREE